MRRKQEFVRNGVCVHGKGGAFHRMRSECATSRGDDEGGIRREVAGWRVSRTATEVLQQHVGQTVRSLKPLPFPALLQEGWST